MSGIAPWPHIHFTFYRQSDNFGLIRKGVAMQFEKKSLEILAEALERMEAGFGDIPDTEYNYDYEAYGRSSWQLRIKIRTNNPY
jgi:hypothetical protein